MPKMFGFSRRKTKLGRLKSHLGDPLQGTKSPLRPTKGTSQSNGVVKEENIVSASASGCSEEFNSLCSSDASDLNNCSHGNSENWMVLSTSGVRPSPRFHHAAAVIGNKMVVVGGDSGHGMLDDTMILDLDKLTWAAATPKVHLSQTRLPLKIPSCKGHCLVPWGKVVLLVGGKTDPVNNKVSVWSFNTETECWSNIDAKGDIPGARSGHIVIRAGPVLILFGGEDAKGRKLKDLHMFDLKSLTWLPLNYTGTGPSPRSNHVAALVDDRNLLVFGGHSRTKILNDLYSLDFETMVWTKVKTKGHHPSPRAGCCGALCGTKWYIVGGGSKKRRHAETLVFDISTYEWSVYASSLNAAITTNKGFSLIPMYHKDKMFLVAFGGTRKEPSNQIEILVMVNEHSKNRRYTQDADPSACEDYSAITKEHGTHLNGSSRFVDSVARNSLASALEHHVSGRKSVSDSSTTDPNLVCGSVSHRKQLHNEEDCDVILKAQKSIEDGRYKESDNKFQTSSNGSLQGVKQRISNQETTIHMDIAGVLANSDENIVTVDSEVSTLPQKRGHNNLKASEEWNAPLESDGRPPILTNPSNIYQLYETKVATLTRKNSILEGKLAGALANQEATEKNLSSVIKSKQDAEKKLTDSMKEVELLKEKMASMELAQEEANSLSNIVHSDNVRLEHDVAFLKAILDDTQKELHSTRGVLTGERARAFQLQVEVFHLKQRLQTLESRVPTPRKPYCV